MQVRGVQVNSISAATAKPGSSGLRWFSPYLINNHGAHINVAVRPNLSSWRSLIAGVDIMDNVWNNFVCTIFIGARTPYMVARMWA